MTDTNYEFQHGTQAEHDATISRARVAGVCRVWSGDVRRNPYLMENLFYGQASGAFKLLPRETEQESGWDLEWSPAG